MPFVRTKTIKGIVYHYLVESYRDEGGKVRQRVLAYLGVHPTVEAALAHWRSEARTADNMEREEYARDMVKKLKAYN